MPVAVHKISSSVTARAGMLTLQDKGDGTGQEEQRQATTINYRISVHLKELSGAMEAHDN